MASIITPLQTLILSLWALIRSLWTSIIIPVIQTLFGLGEVVLARLFIVCILTIIFYKIMIKLTKSAFMAFIGGFAIAILGVRIIPKEVLPMLMTGYYAIALVGIFILFTIFFRTVWWLRKGLLFALMAIFAWLYYSGRNSTYLIAAAILFVFLLLDTYIHQMLEPLRKKFEKSSKLKARIKIKQKEITDAMVAGATKSGISVLQKELDELIKEKSK